MVPDDGRRHIANTVAEQPRPIRQIDVFMRGKEILVEPTQLIEDFPGHQACGATDAKHLLRLVAVGGPASVQTLEGTSDSQKAVASTVDDAGIVHIDNA